MLYCRAVRGTEAHSGARWRAVLAAPFPVDAGMELYHFSEEPDIQIFVPRLLPAAHRAGRTDVDVPLVWAIDEEHAPLYYFPRNCPRIAFWPRPDTTPEDRERWWGERRCSMVACVEWAWLDRLRETRLYRYTMPPELFRFHSVPGTWVSREAVVPQAVEPVGDLLEALRSAGVELRFMPSLTPLRGMWDTTMHTSGIRLRNAQGWE